MRSTRRSACAWTCCRCRRGGSARRSYKSGENHGTPEVGFWANPYCPPMLGSGIFNLAPQCNEARMETKTRRTDKKGRVSLFQDFADHLVIVKRVSDDEVRVIKAKAVPKKYSLPEMLKQITPETLHEEIDTGPSVGAEAW